MTESGAYLLSRNYTNLVALGITNIRFENDKAYFTVAATGEETEVDLLEKTTLSSELVASTNIGSVTAGKTYPAGTKLETIIREILTTYSKAVVRIVLDPAVEIYDAVTDSLSTVSISSTITKGTNNIVSVSFYVDGIEVKEITTGVQDGGTFVYDHNFDAPTSSTFTVKVSVFDGQETATETKTVTFVPRTYYGTLDKSITTPTESDIKGLTDTVLKNTQKFTWENIDCQDAKLVYAYPKQFPALTSIKDGMDFPYIDSYTETNITVDGYDYRCYLLNIEMTCDASEGFKQVFA